MSQLFRFPTRPNRAAEINWQPWGSPAFARADQGDQPILLCLTAVWCHWCQQMDETTYSDPAVIQLINDNFVAIRVDADQLPHVHDRYIASGWPTNAFLTPTGEVLWTGTFIPSEQLIAVADSVRNAWAERRAELSAEIERRRKALEAARGRVKTIGLVRREAADDVWSAATESFDPRNGGFGSAPKHPAPDVVELAFIHSHADEGSGHIAQHTLDGMLAGDLWDAEGGGFFRYALGADWSEPQTEKLLTVNAGLLRAYALGACLLQRDDWRRTAERIVQWACGSLQLENGFWAASQAASPEYYALHGAVRREQDAPPIDRVVYTNANAQWLGALAEAGGRLGRGDWIAAAATGMRQLLAAMRAPNQLMHHYQVPGAAPELPHLLLDLTNVARAAIVVGQAAGDRDLIVAARALVTCAEKEFWADDGGFYDRTRNAEAVGVLRYRDRPFDLNAELARVLLDLALAFGERSSRALAERTLAMLSPLAGRYGLAGANFALAVHEFFEPPTQLIVTGHGPVADQLRHVALALPVAGRRVWPLPEGGRIGSNNFLRLSEPAVYAVGPHGVSRPITDPMSLAAAVTHIV